MYFIDIQQSYYFYHTVHVQIVIHNRCGQSLSTGRCEKNSPASRHQRGIKLLNADVTRQKYLTNPNDSTQHWLTDGKKRPRLSFIFKQLHQRETVHKDTLNKSLQFIFFALVRKVSEEFNLVLTSLQYYYTLCFFFFTVIQFQWLLYIILYYWNKSLSLRSSFLF